MISIKRRLGLQWLNKHKVLSALLALIVVALGFWGYQIYAKHANKVAFEQARSAIDTIYADIVSQLGPPDDNKSTTRCSSVQEEFGDGPMSCFIDVKYIYPVDNKQEADRLKENIKKIISNHKKILTLTQTPINAQGIMSSANNDSSPDRSFYKAKGQIDCVATYVYDPSFDTSLILRSPKKILYTDINCSGGARAAYFQLQK